MMNESAGMSGQRKLLKNGVGDGAGVGEAGADAVGAAAVGALDAGGTNEP